MPSLRLACVAAPTSNAFIVEILEAVADEVRALGVDAFVHSGTVADVADDSTAFLIVPHEYYWFNPRPAAEHLRRTITLDTEHPGTDAFKATSRVAQVVGAAFTISTDSVAELALRGVQAELFTIGYNRRWDMWGGVERERSVDLSYMAAADPERVQMLARLAPQLAGVDANLLIPPYEHRIAPRPDFLMGEAKWRFLSDVKVLLNLHREAKTALELIRVVEAMCNGCVVLTEPSTALGPIEPGTHMLVAPRESIGLAARDALADGEGLRAMRHAAYELCKRELSMRASAERLVAVAEDVVRRARTAGTVAAVNMPDWPEVRPPHVPELAFWVPEPYPLPNVRTALAEPARSRVRALAAARRGPVALLAAEELAPAAAEVDVLLVATAGSGPLARTLASLQAQPLATNVHVASLGTDLTVDRAGLNTHLTCGAQTSVGAARNELLERSRAPYVLVLEPGDELLGGSLATMVARLREVPTAAISYPMAALGEQTVVNLFHPELQRLARFNYLTRGYLARRAWLRATGGFGADPVLDAYVDADLWLRVAASGTAVEHIHRIGARLWPVEPERTIETDPGEVLTLMTERARDAMRPTIAVEAELPKVSALMGAYNYGRYIGESIESAMAQDYPPELLELIIVDDGSSDDTAEIVAGYMERHPGRITFVQQPNAGATAAVNRARQEASGGLIALLDADDVWVPEKTRKQVALLQSRPELGLVFSWMRLIDGDGRRLHDQYGHREQMPANDFARVLWENVAVQSSLIVEAELFEPMPPEVPYADWWLCLRAAQFKHVDYLREDLVYYRWHDANITGGVGGAKALREGQKGISFQRWVVRAFEPHELISRLSPAEMAYVWTGLENQGQKGLSGLGSSFGRLATVDEADRAAARADAEAAERAAADGDLHLASFMAWRARMCDPYDPELRARFDALVAEAEAAKSYNQVGA